MSILLSIRLFSKAKAPFDLNVFMTPMHADRAFRISSVPCMYYSCATCCLASDTSDDTLIRLTGCEVHVCLARVAIAYAAVMQYAFVPKRGLARARDAGYACKSDQSPACRPSIALESCHIPAIACIQSSMLRWPNDRLHLPLSLA